MAILRKKAITILLILTLLITPSITPVNAESGYGLNSWHHKYINTKDAWNLLDKFAPNNKPVLVASIDTGVNLRSDSEVYYDMKPNLDLDNCVKISADGSAVKYVGKKPKHNHGTSSALIIGSSSNNYDELVGVAAGNRNNIVRLMCINVSTEIRNDYCKNRVRDTTPENIIAGMNYAVEHGARIIHMCLGHNKNYKDAYGRKFDVKKIQKAIDNIVENHPNVIIIASAGNKNSTKTWYMGDYKGVCSIINSSHYTNIYSKNTKASSSNFGKDKEFSAPGKGIAGLNNKNYGGTSAASAVAAGVAALIIYANPKLSSSQVRQIMSSTAIDLYKDGFDIYTGSGNLNAYNGVIKALNLAGNTDLPSIIKRKFVDMDPIKLSGKKEGKAIKLKWSKAKTTAGHLNQYRIYVKTRIDGTYRQLTIKKASETSYTYKPKELKKVYYFKVKPFGTTYDGKSFTISDDDSEKNVVEIKTK